MPSPQPTIYLPSALSALHRRVWRGSIRPEAQLTLLNTDPHAPAKFRAIGAPSNMPEFAQAFQCKAGDAMVRGGDKQVKIW